MKKITTLVLASRTEYLKEFLCSFRNQTYKNFTIIFSDDSAGGEVSRLIQSEPLKSIAAGLDIRLIEGPRKGAYQNFVHVLKLGAEAGDLLHLMCDDDIIYPRFYEYHAGAHETPGVACSVSRRWTADITGMPVGSLLPPPFIEKNMARAFILDPEWVFRSTIFDCNNWLGEYSNTVFTREMVPSILEKDLGGIPQYALFDMRLFLQSSLKRLVFIQDYLGFWRMSPGQVSGQSKNPLRKAAYLCWCALAAGAVSLNRLSREEAYLTFQKMDRMLRGDYAGDETMQKFTQLFARHTQLSDTLIDEFTALWRDFLQENSFLN